MRRDRRYWTNLSLYSVVLVALGAAFVVGWLSYARAMLLVHPSRNKPGITPADLGIARWQEVRFASADGLLLAAWFVPPDPQGDGATLIFCHGLGNNRAELLNQAAMLAEYSYGALLIDLRNHGDSEGTFTTLSQTEIADVHGAVDFLLAQPEVNPERIGAVGMSLGAVTLIRAAARTETIRAVIAQSAFTALEDNIADGVRAFTGLPPFPFAPLVIWFGEREAGFKVSQVRPIDEVAQIAPRAIMFVHGELDTAIPAVNSRRLFAAAGEPKELYILPNAGHGGFLASEPEEFERRVVDFLDTHLRRTNYE